MAADLPDDFCRSSPIPPTCWAREMTTNYVDDDQAEPDWGPQNTISKRTVVLTCGAFSRTPNVSHVHDRTEIELARGLANEWAGMLSGVNINQGDESDHLLRPIFAAAHVQRRGGDGTGAEVRAAPRVITEELVRSLLFGDSLDPRYPLKIKPLPLPPAPVGESERSGGSDHTGDPMEAGWLNFRDDILGIDDSYLTNEPHWRDGDGAQEVVKWRCAYEWLVTHVDIIPGSACLISMYEPRHVNVGPPPANASLEEQREHWRRAHAATPMGCIFPRIFAALTHAGSIVGVGAVVVHT